jgi:Holliday junction resolvasome RuvABC DNA-binding subunit
VDAADRTRIIMTDEIANTARLMKVAEAVVHELDRQGVAEALAALGFDPMEMAEAVVKAAEGDVVPFPMPRH